MTTTITITSPRVTKPMISVGEQVRIVGQKRIWLVVNEFKDEDSAECYAMNPIYKPSPRSKLKNKTVFSKVKMKIKN